MAPSPPGSRANARPRCSRPALVAEPEAGTQAGPGGASVGKRRIFFLSLKGIQFGQAVAGDLLQLLPQLGVRRFTCESADLFGLLAEKIFQSHRTSRDLNQCRDKEKAHGGVQKGESAMQP